MANVATITPLNQFFDTNGSPLNSGYLFFGSPNQDPEQFPVQMFWDAAGTVPALQPIRTISGYPSRAGSPAIIYGPDSYSLRVRNSASVQVLYAPDLGGIATSAALAASSGSSLIGFIQSGVGAIARTLQDKGREIFGIADYGTLAQAKTAAGNSSVIDPVGIEYKDVFNNAINVYNESGETTRFAAKVTRSFENAGVHSGIEKNVQHIEFRPIGSGTNGPTSADYGLSISAIKQNYLSSATNGEIDGVNIIVRNGVGDCAAILANVGVRSGYAAFSEAITTEVNAAGTVLRSIRTQIGVVDPVTPNYLGFLAIAGNDALGGNLGAAFQAQNTASAVGWTDFLRYISDNGAGFQTYFRVNREGHIVLNSGGATTPLKYVRVGAGGDYEIVNNANTAVIFSLTDAGSINIPTGANYAVNNIGVVGARRTGWSAATGTGTRTTFNTATVTTSELAERVKALLDDLLTHGLIGA